MKRERIWGEEGNRRESATSNQESKPWITEEKRSQSLRFSAPFGTPQKVHSRHSPGALLGPLGEHFTWQNNPENPRASQPLQHPSHHSRNKQALTTKLSPAQRWGNNGAWEQAGALEQDARRGGGASVAGGVRERCGRGTLGHALMATGMLGGLDDLRGLFQTTEFCHPMKSSQFHSRLEHPSPC